MKNHILLILKVTLTALLVFALMRLVLLLANYQYFSALTFFDYLFAFVHGLRFDLATIAWLIFPLLLLSFIAVRIVNLVALWLCFVSLAIAILGLSMDVVFFQYVNRHIGNELLQVKGNLSYLSAMMLSYWHWTAVYFLALIGFGFWWQKKIISPCQISKKIGYKFILLPIFLTVSLIAMRGGFTEKPMGVADAFVNDSHERAGLTLNGIYSAFSISDSGKNSQHYQYQFFSDQEIEKQLKLKPNYPFKNQYSFKSYKPSVIVLQIESLNFQFIDGLSNRQYGVTPYLDQLLKKSKVFNKFYAAGQRSIVGLQASWYGIPALLGLPTVDNGLISNKTTQVAKLAVKQGYRTFFAQSSPRTSFRVHTLAKNLGFEHYFGMEDIDKLLIEYPGEITPIFGYDYETLMLLQKQIFNHFEHQNNPVLIGFFSGTTHTPYLQFPAKFTKYQHQSYGLNGMLNSVHYLDWSIKQFIEGMRAKPWFKDIVFIITADHVNAKYLPKESDNSDYFHIPLIVYSENQDLLKGLKTEQVRSQLDLMPTIVDLIGSDSEFYALGNSLYKDNKYPMIINSGYILDSIVESGFIKTNLQKILQTNLPQSQAQKLYQEFLMINQRAAVSLRNNKWAE